MMNGRQTLYTTSIHAGVVVASIIAVTILGVQGTIDGQSVVAVLAAAIGFAGANAASFSSISGTVNGKSVVTPQLVAEQGQTNRTAILAALATDPATMPHVEADTPGAGG